MNNTEIRFAFITDANGGFISNNLQSRIVAVVDGTTAPVTEWVDVPTVSIQQEV